MYFHAQNLNEKSGGRRGSMLRNGRCWWQLWERACVRFEWSFRFSGPRFELHLASGQDGDLIGIGIGIVFLSLWLTFEYWKWAKWLERKIKRPDQKYGNGRVIGFYCYDGRLWISFWRDDMEWQRSDPWWNVLLLSVLPTYCWDQPNALIENSPAIALKSRCQRRAILLRLAFRNGSGVERAGHFRSASSVLK